MDPINLLYYGIICGILSLFAPRLRRTPIRFCVGIAVGLGAAGFLPAVRMAMGL